MFPSVSVVPLVAEGSGGVGKVPASSKAWHAYLMPSGWRGAPTAEGTGIE